MGEMTLVILAAGDGGRLGRQKALLEFGGRALVEHIIDAFETAGIHRAVIVEGYRGDLIFERLGRWRGNVRIRYVINNHWAETKTGDSLVLASSYWWDRDFVIASADHLFGPRLAAQLVDGPPTHVLADGNLDLDGEETVLIGTDEGHVERLVYPASTLGKGIEWTRGECPELFKVSESDNLLAQNLEDVDVFEAINKLPDVRWSHTDEPWIEIDTPEDLERAQEVWKRIEASDDDV